MFSLFKFLFEMITMVGVTNIPVTTKEFNDYKKIIDNNKNITLSTYFAKIIKRELELSPIIILSTYSYF